MKIADCTGRTLRWQQTRLTERRYQLLADDVEVGVLTFRTALGSLATGESGEGSWTFKRVGFFKTRITVRATGGDADLAVFEPATWSSGGTLSFPDGRTVRVTTNFWQTSLDLAGDGDEALLHVAVRGLFRLAAEIEILPAGARHDALPWLVLLACYLLVVMRDDSAAVAVVASG